MSLFVGKQYPVFPLFQSKGRYLLPELQPVRILVMRVVCIPGTVASSPYPNRVCHVRIISAPVYFYQCLEKVLFVGDEGSSVNVNLHAWYVETLLGEVVRGVPDIV